MSWFDLFELSKDWVRLCVISCLAATVQMYLTGKKFTFFHYFMSVIVAVFAAYLAEAFCEWRGFGDSLRTGVIGVSAYAAPHILEGLNKFFAWAANNPREIFKRFIGGK